MRRMKTETKRKIAGFTAFILALAMILSAVSVVTGFKDNPDNTVQTTTEEQQ